MKTKAIDDLYEHLKRRILRGEIRANERIVEQDLAARYKLSRTPVREVLNRLVNEGLLVAIPHLGTFVRQYSYQEVNEIFEIRAELEGLAIRLAASRMSEQEAAELIDIANEIDNCRKNECWSDAYRHDQAFHRYIAAHCGNAMLARTLENYDFKVTCIYVNLARADWNSNADIVRVPHLEIANAIKSRQPELASQLIKQHIAWARSTLTK